MQAAVDGFPSHDRSLPYEGGDGVVVLGEVDEGDLLRTEPGVHGAPAEVREAVFKATVFLTLDVEELLARREGVFDEFGEGVLVHVSKPSHHACVDGWC